MGVSRLNFCGFVSTENVTKLSTGSLPSFLIKLVGEAIEIKLSL